MVLLDSNKVNEQHSSQAKHSRCLQVVRQIISGLKCPGVMTGNITKFIIILDELQKNYTIKISLINLQKNSKQTWSVIMEVLGTSKHKDQIPINFQKNRQVISDCLEIVNGFNGFFAGIGPKLAAEIGPSDVSFESYLTGNNTSSFEFSRISEIDILYISKQLKPKMSS